MTIHEYKTRDQYNRPNLMLEIATTAGRATVVMITFPRIAREADPAKAYLVNDRSLPRFGGIIPDDGVMYFAKRSDALAHARRAASAAEERLEAEARRLPAAASIGDGNNGCRMYHGQEVFARTDDGQRVLLGTLVITDGVPALVQA